MTAGVSIPSSSGHQFTEPAPGSGSRTRPKFQSLLHQGISLLWPWTATAPACPPPVSIPSSSGHQFTASAPPDGRSCPRRRFNPFFIRASVYCAPSGDSGDIAREVSIPSSSGHQFTGNLQGLCRPCHQAVSIPSSSGHQFTVLRVGGLAVRDATAFQSLLHQGISLLAAAEAARAEKSARAFQSLLHQGISLLLLTFFMIHPAEDSVSIPSSSGHQFTECMVFQNDLQYLLRFNPFFIRASVY